MPHRVLAPSGPFALPRAFCSKHLHHAQDQSLPMQLRWCEASPRTDSDRHSHRSHLYFPSMSFFGGSLWPRRWRAPHELHNVDGPPGPLLLPLAITSFTLHQPQRQTPPEHERSCPSRPRIWSLFHPHAHRYLDHQTGAESMCQDQDRSSPYILHGAYYSKDRGSRSHTTPKTGVAGRIHIAKDGLLPVHRVFLWWASAPGPEPRRAC